MRIWSFLPPHSWRTIIPTLVVGTINAVCTVGLMYLINTALADRQAGSAEMGWVYLVVGLLTVTMRVLSQTLLTYLSENVSFELRMYLSQHILKTSYQYLEELKQHRLLTSLTQDVTDISRAIAMLPSLYMAIMTLLVSLIYIGFISWIILVFVLVFAVVGVFSYQYLEAYAQRSLRAAREEQDTLFRHFGALTEGLKELKMNHGRRRVFLAELLHPTAAALRKQNFTGTTLYNIAQGWGDSLFFTLVGVLLFVVARFPSIDIIALFSATLALFYVFGPLGSILQMAPTIGRGRIAASKVERMLPALSTHTTEADELLLPGRLADWQQLELAHVRHTYHHEQNDASFTLGPISLRFTPGELVFLVGGNGSGKSTFAKLLVGLYTPESGSISLNGTPITDQTRESYRQLFSVIFSDFYLFDRLLGIVSPDLDEQARSYLRLLQLDHKVTVRDGQLSTIALSQGQRKRLALLTAYLEDRPFYVFDEWAADQDPAFKEVFYTVLLPDLKQRGKTVLVITHDDKYFHLADRMIKLDYGQLDYDMHPTPLASAPVLDPVAPPPAAHG